MDSGGAVPGVEDLFPAGRTGCDVRRDQLIAALLFQALLYFKPVKTGGGKVRELQGFNARPRRGLKRQLFGELFNRRAGTFDLEVDPG
jgi:hypothetical protein